MKNRIMDFITLYNKISYKNPETFICSHFEKYKDRLGKKIDNILKYDETDINFFSGNQWECALPGFKKYLESGYYRYMFGRYLYSIKYIKNKSVLDAGCGLGWGSYLISDYPREMISIDVNKEALNFAMEKWKDSKLNFKKHSVLDLGGLHKKFNVILGFELIEHLIFSDGKRFLEQAFNSLQRKGLLILSSTFPDSKEDAKILEKKQTYHLKIFTKRELKMIIRKINYRKIIFIGNLLAIIKK